MGLSAGLPLPSPLGKIRHVTREKAEVIFGGTGRGGGVDGLRPELGWGLPTFQPCAPRTPCTPCTPSTHKVFQLRNLLPRALQVKLEDVQLLESIASGSFGVVRPNLPRVIFAVPIRADPPPPFEPPLSRSTAPCIGSRAWLPSATRATTSAPSRMWTCSVVRCRCWPCWTTPTSSSLWLVWITTPTPLSSHADPSFSSLPQGACLDEPSKFTILTEFLSGGSLYQILHFHRRVCLSLANVQNKLSTINTLQPAHRLHSIPSRRLLT